MRGMSGVRRTPLGCPGCPECPRCPECPEMPGMSRNVPGCPCRCRAARSAPPAEGSVSTALAAAAASARHSRARTDSKKTNQHETGKPDHRCQLEQATVKNLVGCFDHQKGPVGPCPLVPRAGTHLSKTERRNPHLDAQPKDQERNWDITEKTGT